MSLTPILQLAKFLGRKITKSVITDDSLLKNVIIVCIPKIVLWLDTAQYGNLYMLKQLISALPQESKIAIAQAIHSQLSPETIRRLRIAWEMERGNRQ